MNRLERGLENPRLYQHQMAMLSCRLPYRYLYVYVYVISYLQFMKNKHVRFYTFLFFCFLIQKHQGQNNQKTATEKYSLEPTIDTTHGFFSHSGQSMHPSAFGSSRNMNACSSHYMNGEDLRMQESCTHRAASQLSRFSSSVAVRGASKFDGVLQTSVNPHWPEERISARYCHHDNGASSEKHVWSHHLQDRRRSAHKKDEQPLGKESAAVSY